MEREREAMSFFRGIVSLRDSALGVSAKDLPERVPSVIPSRLPAEVQAEVQHEAPPQPNQPPPPQERASPDSDYELLRVDSSEHNVLPQGEAKDDANVSTTRSASTLPATPPTRVTRKRKRDEAQKETVEALIPVPLYKSTNSKRKQKKGDVCISSNA